MPRAKKKVDLDRGYVCPCRRYNPFHVWVYAHPAIRIEHKCKCGRTNIIQDLRYMETLKDENRK